MFAPLSPSPQPSPPRRGRIVRRPVNNRARCHARTRSHIPALSSQSNPSSGSKLRAFKVPKRALVNSLSSGERAGVRGKARPNLNLGSLRQQPDSDHVSLLRRAGETQSVALNTRNPFGISSRICPNSRAGRLVPANRMGTSRPHPEVDGDRKRGQPYLRSRSNSMRVRLPVWEDRISISCNCQWPSTFLKLRMENSLTNLSSRS